MPSVYRPHMDPTDRDVALVVGADLLGRTRIEEAVARSGLAPLAVNANKLSEMDISAVKAVFADVDSDDVLDAVSILDVDPDRVLLVGYYAHVDRARAERIKQAGWQAMPRGRLFRELPEMLADL